MHIVGIVLAVLTGAAVWWWRLKLLKEAGDDVADMVGRVRGRYRMGKFKKKVEGSVLASIDDPALAAAVFLFTLANENPAIRHLSEDEIRSQIAPTIPAAELDEVVAYARWAARDLADPLDVIRRFKPLWREKLTPEERVELVGMSEAVIALGDKPEPGQTLSLQTLRTALVP